MRAVTTKEHDDRAFDVHYGHWYNLKCERFYRHLDVTLSVVQMVGGSASGLAVLNQSGLILSISGVLLACASALSLTVQPSVKVERHSRAKNAYVRLMAEMGSLDTVELAKRLADVRADAPTGPQWIEGLAFNATLRSLGYGSGFVETTRLQRVLDAVA